MLLYLPTLKTEHLHPVSESGMRRAYFSEKVDHFFLFGVRLFYVVVGEVDDAVAVGPAGAADVVGEEDFAFAGCEESLDFLVSSGLFFDQNVTQRMIVRWETHKEIVFLALRPDRRPTNLFAQSWCRLTVCLDGLLFCGVAGERDQGFV